MALVGDAIHPMTPDLGQGACQAIVDGTTLADCLREIPDVPRALDAYRRSRFRNAAIATLFARAWGSYGKWDGSLTCAVRNAAVRAMPLWLQLRQLDLVIGRPPKSKTSARKSPQASDPQSLRSASTEASNPHELSSPSASSPVRYRPAVASP